MAAAPAGGVDMRALLVGLCNDSDAIRNAAEKQVYDMRTANGPLLMSMLSASMVDATMPADAKAQAALYMKNMLDPANIFSAPGVASEEQRMDVVSKAWLELPNKDAMRNQAVQALISTSDSTEQRTAALLVAKIAAIELPDTWPGLFPGLIEILNRPDTHATVRRGILICASFIASEADESAIDETTTSHLLKHCVAALAPDQGERSLQRAGIDCLAALVDFCSHIFLEDARRVQRDYLVKIFVDAAGHADEEIRASALRSLADIARKYYRVMQPYMAACLGATEKVIAHIADETSRDGLFAFEFWASVGEVEADLPDGESRGYLAAAVPRLGPAAWTVYTTKRDSSDPTPTALSETVSPVHTASDVLRLMVNSLTPEKAIETFSPLIAPHFTSPDFRMREGALSILGYLASHSEGTATGAALAGHYYPQIMSRLSPGAGLEPDPRVRAPLGWCAGILIKKHFRSAIAEKPMDLFGPSIDVLVQLLSDEPVCARYAAFGISQLCDASSGVARPVALGGGTWLGAETVRKLLHALMTAMNRADAHVANLGVCCMEAIGDVTVFCSLPALPVIIEVISGVCTSIPAVGTQLARAPAGTSSRDVFDKQLANLCGTMTYLCQALRRMAPDVLEADAASASYVAKGMEQVPAVLRQLIAVTGLSDSVSEQEGWIALTAAIECLGDKTESQMPVFMPTLGMGLRNRTNTCVTQSAISITSALTVALGPSASVHFPTFLPEIMDICNSPDVDPDLKPVALSCLADLCFTAGSTLISPNMGPVAEMLARAQMPTLSGADDDDWVILLRTSVLEVYSAIIGSFRGVSSTEKTVVQTTAQQAVRFVRQCVAEMQTMSDEDRQELPPLYLHNLCSVITDTGLLFHPSTIAGEVKAADPWLVALCTFADQVCAASPDGLATAKPGTDAMHVMTTGTPLPR